MSGIEVKPLEGNAITGIKMKQLKGKCAAFCPSVVKSIAYGFIQVVYPPQAEQRAKCTGFYRGFVVAAQMGDTVSASKNAQRFVSRRDNRPAHCRQ